MLTAEAKVTVKEPEPLPLDIFKLASVWVKSLTKLEKVTLGRPVVV